jgi:L-threonylcarbamoyladenylate synthase
VTADRTSALADLEPGVVLPGHDPAAIEQAARHLAAGGCLAFPTETVYGLGARADDDDAVAAIYRIKGRPAGHPLIVHVAGVADAERFADPLPPAARRLMGAFWPGPLTVIVPRRAGMAQAASGGQASIGLRCPSHPVARALLAAAARHGVAGVAGPSANRFGRLSPTCAEHVRLGLTGAVPVLDGGACDVGIESTIVDCSRGAVRWLRPGAVGRAAIEQVLGEPVLDADASAPRAPGTLAAHYAPRARLEVLAASELARRLAEREHDAAPPRSAEAVRRVAVYSRSLPPSPAATLWRAMPADPALAAHELFAVLHDFDADAVDAIWVESVPDTPPWEAVGDRLRRAAARH